MDQNADYSFDVVPGELFQRPDCCTCIKVSIQIMYRGQA